MREVSLDSYAAAHADGAFTVDVREPFEYVSGHIPGATLMPMSRIATRLADLPRTEPVYVVCASGNRSLAVVGQLSAAGYDARSVADGTSGWARSGRPLVTGPRSAVA